MRILLITPVAEGEHHSLFTSLAKAFSELGHEVLHFSQNTKNPEKINLSIPANSKRLKYFSDIYFRFHNYGIALWRIYQEAFVKWQVLFDHIHNLQKDSKGPDLLFFVSLDATFGYCWTRWYIDNKLTIPFSGILVCPEDTRLMAKSFFKSARPGPYNILKSRWCISICVFVEESVSFLSILIHKPVIVLPDIISVPGPIHNNSLGELVRTRARGRFIIGTWGSLAQRKGISEFLQMCLNLPSEKYLFVMGGKINLESLPESDKEILKNASSGIIENMVIVDRWLSDDELLSGMNSCDLIFAAYPSWRFSSGIVGHAAVVRVPILVNDGFVMAKRVKDFNIGFVKQKQADITLWVADNIAAIKKLRDSSLFKEGCSKYCESYGYEQWRKSLAHLIETQIL
jgi:hypothetical protein